MRAKEGTAEEGTKARRHEGTEGREEGTRAGRHEGTEGWAGRSGRWVTVALWVGVAAVSVLLVAKGMPRGLHAHVYEGGVTPRGFDFIHYYLAAEAVTRGEDIYASFQGGYVYPPMLAVALVPLLPLGMDGAAMVWHLLSAGALGAALVITWRDVRRRAGLAGDWGAAGAAVLLTVLAGFDLIKRQFAYCQVDGVVTLGIVIGLAGLNRPERLQKRYTEGAEGDTEDTEKRKFESEIPEFKAQGHEWMWAVLSGVGLAVAINIKFVALGFIPYLLLTRRWAAAGAAVVGTAVIALSTSLVFGWERNLEYLRMSVRGLLHVVGISTASTGGFDPHPITWENSVSVTSALARVAEDGHLGMGVAMGAVATIVVAWGVAAMMMYRARGLSLVASVLPSRGADARACAARPFVVALEWMSVCAAILVFSPQTTKRHALILLPAILVASMLAVEGRRRSARLGAGAALAIIAVAIYFPPGKLLPDSFMDAWHYASVFGWSVMGFGVVLLWSGLCETDSCRVEA